MRRAVFLAAARADLVDILVHITESSGSIATGRADVEELRAQCHKLAGLPGTLGRARPELRPDVRSFPYRHHILYFRYVGGAFEVVNILHARRDVADLFSGGDALR
ncbi:type II toxin-antitoxin system RelE/ParE family toxin [Methylobacterium sp. NEAU 140]|uniref:type II toxin-antitoxin system RelE/ParE family toxin n=1 Tax=Methylobacterium sp. NEAU 140 TaxID=3064945 RepID=UPI0027364818|nr:type II toxin-antitoxin system RelE/ParE family toxin [Methylobacterium sp. NEAU 140]MDP4024071.1 type II toxin-antitoxin system RelE/ParE family toxin [Methylobacterium sp. NEAU 140]